MDWGAGTYETTARELAPVAEAVVEQAGISAGQDVLDVACGTGNAALLAARRGARVVGIDSAPRLLEVARGRARDSAIAVDFRAGDLHALPVPDGSADAVLSIFGVIFAADPALALGEVARVLRPGGRALVTSWMPAGPIHAMLGALQQIVGRVTKASPPPRFAWADARAVESLAIGAGLTLAQSRSALLPIRAASLEAYLDAGQEHPMSLAMRPALEQGGVVDEARDAMRAVLHEANEDPSALLVHSPYVVHELRAD